MRVVLFKSSLKSCRLHLDGALLCALSHCSVCGSRAKSRALYGEWCHLRFGPMVTSGTQRLLLSYRDADVCFFGALNYENTLTVFIVAHSPGVDQHLVLLFL